MLYFYYLFDSHHQAASIARLPPLFGKFTLTHLQLLYCYKPERTALLLCITFLYVARLIGRHSMVRVRFNCSAEIVLCRLCLLSATSVLGFSRFVESSVAHIRQKCFFTIFIFFAISLPDLPHLASLAAFKYRILCKYESGPISTQST